MVKTTKKLLLESGANGLCNNQIQCFQLAATFAIQYNRSLILPRHGYKNSIHGGGNLRLDQMYDLEGFRFSYTVQEANDYSNISKKLDVHPWIKANKQFFEDPFPDEETWQIRCRSGHTLFLAPLSVFPQMAHVLLPINAKYSTLAATIVAQMLGNRSRNDFRILGLQIRAGDRYTLPAVDCKGVNEYPYRTFTDCAGGIFSAFCGNRQTDSRGYHSFNSAHALTW
eukprot:CAMPEP_0116545992 /NCGR_PEP_ID=MMETSP0397-20121206/2981_1 /TAXON_ID=216820 /ORGANISM="Cyclophora tenuis, Strain ECT3854" /LENGTH=225 /DNA_ID=CAMNT_0004070377 /DNA_START=53 /DNA_END=727 /DNA_ORIENTATION=+